MKTGEIWVTLTLPRWKLPIVVLGYLIERAGAQRLGKWLMGRGVYIHT